MMLGITATDALGIQSGVSGLCSGVCKTGLVACDERVCQGTTYTSYGWQWAANQGLREAGTAQRNDKPWAFCAKQESKRAEGFSHSPRGCDACVARVARGVTHALRGWPWMDTLGSREAWTAQLNGDPGLARSMDSVAQWVYDGPEDESEIPLSYYEAFLSRYIPEVLDFRYFDAPLERDAREQEER